MSDASKPPAEGDDRRNLTTRQGHPVTNNQNAADGRRPRPGHARELPLPREDQPLRPRADPRARGARARASSRTASSRPTARSATSRSRRTPAPSCSRRRASRPRSRVRFSTVIGGRDSLRGRARPARLRGQVLHRGRQLGPGRQQPAGLLHPRRDQVPRRDPLAEARPGHVPPGAEPHLRLHEPDARVDAHADAGCSARAASRPSYRTRTASASTPTRWSTPPARPCWSSTTGSRSRASKSLTAGRRPTRSRPRTSATPPRTSYEAIERGDYPEWELCVQIMSDDEHPELDFDPLDDTKIWPEDEFPLRPVGRDDARTATSRTTSPRTSRSPSAPACWSTGSTSPTTRCWSAARSRTPTRSATASARTTCSCRSTARSACRSATNQRDGQMAYGVDDAGRQPARQLRAARSRRARRGGRA